MPFIFNNVRVFGSEDALSKRAAIDFFLSPGFSRLFTLSRQSQRRSIASFLIFVSGFKNFLND